jgi:C-terminal processing protease CtpA/Prc
LSRSRWIAAALLLTMMNARAQAPNPALDETLDAPYRARIINDYAHQLTERHVDAVKGKQAADMLRTRLARGEYDDITSARVFAARLTPEVAEIVRDRQTYLEYIPYDQTDSRQRPAPAQQPSDNFGLRKYESMEGNIAYLQISRFAPFDRAAYEAAGRFMSQAADHAALIIDLRGAGGDGQDMAAMLASYVLSDTRSYFFRDKQLHLHNQVDRGGRVSAEYWTRAEVPGQRFGGKKPLYLLVNERTSAAAEGFAYDLQQYKRAVVVGSPTLGDAQIRATAPISRHLLASVAVTRAVNKISGGNWQGVGVQPDRMVAPAEALNEALKLATAAVEKNRASRQ